MGVQRYLFRYKARDASYYAAIQARRLAAGQSVVKRSASVMAAEWNANFAGRFEKEGGSFTSEISEAKLIGWRSKRFMGRDDGDLLPARIILESDYDALRDAADKLAALEAAGVDNWEGYENAMAELGA